VILPRPGKKSPARKQHERQPWFVRGRRWHAGVEGRISLLKPRFGLDRCLDHGAHGFEKWVGRAVIAANLSVIGKKVAANA
jgi:IS5 family transposase